MDWKKVVDFAVDFQKQTEELQEMELRDEAARRAFDTVTKEEIRKKREEREAEQQWKRDMLNEAQISNKQLAEMNQLMADKLSQTNATLDFMLNALGCNFQRLERTQIKAGMVKAKDNGKSLGRPRSTVDDIPASFFKHYPALEQGMLNKSEFARVCGLSRPTV